MAEKTAKSKAVTCALCDKAITTGKPVIIDDDPYHPDCAKAMNQSADADVDDEDEEDAEAEEAEVEDEDEDEDEEEAPAPRRAKSTPVRATSKRTVVVEDEDEDEDDDDEEEEEEEVVVTRKPAKAAPARTRRAAAVVEDDEDEDDEEEEEEEVRPARKATTTKATVKTAAKPARRAAPVEEDEEYEEEEEPEARPTRKATAKASTNGTRKKSTVDNSGWGNPAGEGTKRWFVYNAMKEVTKTDLAKSDGPGKPENILAAARRAQRDWARAEKKTLSEKDRNFSSMNVNWIYNHADELGLVARQNAEAGTYRIIRAKAQDEDSD